MSHPYRRIRLHTLDFDVGYGGIIEDLVGR